MSRWSFEDIPEQGGCTAIVTGSNSGIGYETARALALKGSRVVLACRSAARGADAVRRIEAERPKGSVEFKLLDLADLDSVRALAEDLVADLDHLDLLINNAGVMIPPKSKTVQGFELQFGVNYLGHFLLTGLLVGRLTATRGARVVTISSLAHRIGRIDFDNLQCEKPYRPTREYAQSKLADLIFAIELHRRLKLAGVDTASVAAHPGSTATALQRHSVIVNFLAGLWSNNPVQGALPTLYAATAPEASRGGYYGPDGLFEARGFPSSAKVISAARDRQTAKRLWQVAEKATGIRFL